MSIGQHHLHGSYVDIIEELSTTLNFRPSYFRSPTPLWSDLIQSLADKDYDLSATNSAITIDRSKLVDFSVPISAVNYMYEIRDIFFRFKCLKLKDLSFKKGW